MGHVEFRPDQMEGREPYYLATSLVVPRPIAWISTLSDSGVRNLAPHSYFNVISTNPMIVHFTSTGVKDTLRNVRATGEFVVNLVDRTLAEQMNTTAANFPPDEDEFSWAGLDAEPSVEVAPQRVAGAKAVMECKVRTVLSMGNGNMVFGDVLCVHVDESVLTDGRVDPKALDAIGRLGGSSYTAAATGIFELRRPTFEELTRES